MLRMSAYSAFASALFISLLGLIALVRLPVQLLPDLSSPKISVETTWRAASPEEVEQEILQPQEELLRGISGLRQITSSADSRSGYLELSFDRDTNMQQALIETAARLNRLDDLPSDALAPVVTLGGARSVNEDSVVSWFFLQDLAQRSDINDQLAPFNKLVRPRLEQISGVAGVFVSEIDGDELHIEFDHHRMSAFKVSLSQLARAVLDGVDLSGGFLQVGANEYTIRFNGKVDLASFGERIVDWRHGDPIRVKDVANVRVAKADKRHMTVQNGQAALAIRVDKQANANLYQTLQMVKAEVAQINQQVLGPRGLRLEQSFDASPFITRAIGLVASNLVLGSLLAFCIVFYFMRSVRATSLVVALVPICLCGTLIMLYFMDRSINVVSIAGLAFAVGIVLDAGIIVVDRISNDQSRADVPLNALEVTTSAIPPGTPKTHVALLASTITTVIVFVPVAFLDGLQGELFADLAFTITTSVVLSYFVATRLIPAVASAWLRDDDRKQRAAVSSRRLSKLVRMFTKRSVGFRIAYVVAVVGAGAAIMPSLLPNKEILPPLKKDAIDAYFSIPEGTSMTYIQDVLVADWVDQLESHRTGQRKPYLRNYFVDVWTPTTGLISARPQDVEDVQLVEKLLYRVVTSTNSRVGAFVHRGTLFGGVEKAGMVEVHLQDADSDRLLRAAQAAQARLQQELGPGRIQIEPGLSENQPQIRVTPRQRQIYESGFSQVQVANAVRAMIGGFHIGEYYHQEKSIDILLKAKSSLSTDQINTLPIVSDTGQTTFLGQLVEIEHETGPSQIRRVHGQRTITLRVSLREGETTQSMLEVVARTGAKAAERHLSPLGQVVFGAKASELDRSIGAILESFGLASIALAFILATFFRSARLALISITVIALSAVGSIAALSFVNKFWLPQSLDIITMIGLIIMFGLVVNNVILLILAWQERISRGYNFDEAMICALEVRSRAIFASCLTSIVGMLPLVFAPGEGSEVYRGLAVAIIGGISANVVLTFLFLPTVLQLNYETNSKKA